MLRSIVIGSLAFALLGSPVAAQGPRLGYAGPVPDSPPASDFRLVGGGVIGFAAAAGAATLIYQLAGGGTICGDDPCGLVGGLIGWILVEPVLVPLGVNLADRREGSYGAALFGSVVVGGGILAAGSRLGLDDELLLVVPVGQILGAVIGEKMSRRN